MTITIAPLDREAKQRLLKAVADRGSASGLRAAAKIIRAAIKSKATLADLVEIAAALDHKADNLASAASAELDKLEAESKG